VSANEMGSFFTRNDPLRFLGAFGVAQYVKQNSLSNRFLQRQAKRLLLFKIYNKQKGKTLIPHRFISSMNSMLISGLHFGNAQFDFPSRKRAQPINPSTH